jgi:hypothetical protein
VTDSSGTTNSGVGIMLSARAHRSTPAASARGSPSVSVESTRASMRARADQSEL